MHKFHTFQENKVIITFHIKTTVVQLTNTILNFANNMYFKYGVAHFQVDF